MDTTIIAAVISAIGAIIAALIEVNSNKERENDGEAGSNSPIWYRKICHILAFILFGWSGFVILGFILSGYYAPLFYLISAILALIFGFFLLFK